MDLCGVCGDYYSVDLQDKPVFSCITCGQGCHDKCFDPVSTLFRGLDATYRKSMQFVCSTCYSDYKPDDEEVVVNAKKSPIKAKTPTHEEELDEEAEDETKTPEPITSKVEEKKQTTDTTNVNLPRQDHQPLNTAETRQKKPMCPQYEDQIRCENYEACKAVYFHPRRCRNMLTFGKCRFGNRCRYHHPKICPKSLTEKKCTNLDCKLFHIKYTVRYSHLSAAVEEEGRPPWHPHPPAHSLNQHQQQTDHQHQLETLNRQHHQEAHHQRQPSHHNPPISQGNHFLFEHIKESNATMKNLQSLISSLIASQNNHAAQPQQPIPPLTGQHPQPMGLNQYQVENQNNQQQIHQFPQAPPQNHLTQVENQNIQQQNHHIPQALPQNHIIQQHAAIHPQMMNPPQ